MMMNEIFARYLEAGIFGSVIILLILVLRLCLRRAPRRILCLLWLLAAVRLLLPFQLESRLSLQPDLDDVAVVIGHEQGAPATNVILPNDVVSVPENEPVYQPQTQPVTDVEKQDKSPMHTMDVLSIIWVSVACSAVIYMVISYMILKFWVREAVRCEDGIMECDRIRGAFLLGYLRPRIYLPFRVSSTDRKFIIAHERAHIARGDNWWKLLGFLCASIHWYNPLVWLSYGLLCRDIELACDERVIRGLDTDERKGYSMALLNCGKSLSGASICPVAFGEVSLKTRIKSILRYRKPGLWITVIAFVLIAATAVCFLTSPAVEALPLETPEKETEPLQTEPIIEVTELETTQTTIQESEPEKVQEIESEAVQETEPDISVPAQTRAPEEEVIQLTTKPEQSTDTDKPENSVEDTTNTSDEGIVASGLWDHGPISWQISTDGVLSFKLNGGVHFQAAYPDQYPWRKYADVVTQITMDEGFHCIPEYVFDGMYNVTDIYLSSSVEEIRDGAFQRCSSLTRITIPSSVESIGNYVFAGCSSLSNVAIAADSRLTEIGKCTFASSGISQFIAPYSLQVIGESAFNSCGSLQKVVLNHGLISIGDQAFRDCSFESIVIPATVNEMWGEVFANGALNEIVFKGGCPYIHVTTTFNGVTATVYYPADDETWNMPNFGGSVTWVPI